MSHLHNGLTRVALGKPLLLKPCLQHKDHYFYDPDYISEPAVGILYLGSQWLGFVRTFLQMQNATFLCPHTFIRCSQWQSCIKMIKVHKSFSPWNSLLWIQVCYSMQSAQGRSVFRSPLGLESLWMILDQSLTVSD